LLLHPEEGQRGSKPEKSPSKTAASKTAPPFTGWYKLRVLKVFCDLLNYGAVMKNIWG
jgi:hypothetical protein